jgi:hypothetical protein
MLGLNSIPPELQRLGGNGYRECLSSPFKKGCYDGRKDQFYVTPKERLAVNW